MSGAEKTKQKSTKFTMCVYWYGIGVVTMRSHVLNAARTRCACATHDAVRGLLACARDFDGVRSVRVLDIPCDER